MPRPAANSRTTLRIIPGSKDYASLAQNARRLAQELEELSASFDRVGGTAVITRYAAANQMNIPSLDLRGPVHALRSNAGVLFLVASSLARRAAAGEPHSNGGALSGSSNPATH